MQDTQRQLQEFLHRLTRRVQWMDQKLQIYNYLLIECVIENADDPPDNRAEAIKLAPEFFACIIDALWKDVIVTLCIMYDKDRGKDAKTSLPHYLTQVSKHFSSLKLSPGSLSIDVVNNQRAMIEREDIQSVIKRVKEHRDKYLAHCDLTYFDNPSKLHKSVPIEYREVCNLVELTTEILQTHRDSILDDDRTIRRTAGDVVCVIASLLQTSKAPP
jgi:hypothetical protein